MEQAETQRRTLHAGAGWQRVLSMLRHVARRGLLLIGAFAVLITVVIVALLQRGRWQQGHLAPWAACGLLILLAFLLVRQTLQLHRSGALAHRLREENLLLNRTNDTLEALATTDALTGLPNWLSLCTELETHLRAGVTDAPRAILLLDLDRFKQINDTLGHYVGDLLLQQVATRLRETVRGTDLVARQGGDEFAALLPDASLAVAIHVARRLIQAIESPFLIDEQTLDIGVSVGIALCPDHAAQALGLLQCADHAMYRAKRSHSGYCLYDPVLDAHSTTTQALITELSQAAANGQLVLLYQPQVDRQTKQIYGMEALIRWNHPTRGLLEPAQFIPLAEDSGTIVPLAYWVLDEALRQCRLWQDAGRQLTVAVNLAARNLRDPQLARKIRDLLLEHGVPAHKLCLELTEGTIMQDAQQIINVLRNLHNLGVKISLDDFGTGYSSLSYLAQLPIDELKIGRSFAQRMVTDSTSATIVASTIGLGRSLGIRVVTQGVEDAATAAMLELLDADGVQGFYFGKPLLPRQLDDELPCGVARSTGTHADVVVQ